jgi:hypothetical protein
MEKQELNDAIEGIQFELNRFQTRLIEYSNRAKYYKWAQRGCKESAALRRSAMDLKNELTKITQSGGY